MPTADPPATERPGANADRYELSRASRIARVWRLSMIVAWDGRYFLKVLAGHGGAWGGDISTYGKSFSIDVNEPPVIEEPA